MSEQFDKLREAAGNTWDSVDAVSYVESLRSDKELPTLHDVQALGPWDTDGLDSVEFCRKIREDKCPTCGRSVWKQSGMLDRFVALMRRYR